MLQRHGLHSYVPAGTGVKSAQLCKFAFIFYLCLCCYWTLLVCNSSVILCLLFRNVWLRPWQWKYHNLASPIPALAITSACMALMHLTLFTIGIFLYQESMAAAMRAYCFTRFHTHIDCSFPWLRPCGPIVSPATTTTVMTNPECSIIVVA